jgi:hypothetical protein
MTINEMNQITKILRDDIFERLPDELIAFLVKNKAADSLDEWFIKEHSNFWSINPALGEVLKERGADIIEVLGLTIWGRKKGDGNIWNDIRLLNTDKEISADMDGDPRTNKEKYIDDLAEQGEQEREEEMEGEEFMALN